MANDGGVNKNFLKNYLILNKYFLLCIKNIIYYIIMSHQDWEPVVWKKEAIVSKPVKEKVSAPRELTGELCSAIQKARMNVKLSQQELAQKLQVKPEVIKEYENGKAIPNNGFIARIEKILNTKLPRAKKKEITDDL